MGVMHILSTTRTRDNAQPDARPPVYYSRQDFLRQNEKILVTMVTKVGRANLNDSSKLADPENLRPPSLVQESGTYVYISLTDQAIANFVFK